MSIQSEIERISGNIGDAYSACNDKGATMPTAENQNSANLADTISSIPAGGGGEVRGSWVVPPLYLEIDAATDDETNEVYRKCKAWVDESTSRKFRAIIGFALPIGCYNITIRFGQSSKRPSAVLVSDGRKFYDSDIDSENGYNSDYTFEFNNMDGSQYLIFYYLKSDQCWNFSPSSSANVYIDSSTKSDIGGFCRYVAIKPIVISSSYFVSWSFNSSHYLESFKIIGDMPTTCKKVSIGLNELKDTYAALKYFPPISEWCQSSVLSSFSGSSDLIVYGYPFSLPYGLDLSQYTGSSALQIGTGNTSVIPSRMSELYVTLPNANVELKGICLTQNNWNYLAEHAPTVSGKTLTITGGYIGSSGTMANPTAAILGEAYTTFVNKGWTISGLRT